MRYLHKKGGSLRAFASCFRAESAFCLCPGLVEFDGSTWPHGTGHLASALVTVILYGGTGTWLWPLSRATYPKQYWALIGLGEGEFLCASDTPALAGFTCTILPLEDGEVALLTPLGIELNDQGGARVQRKPSLLSGTEHFADKRSFKHFMLNEIHEQPETAALWVACHLSDTPAGTAAGPLAADPAYALRLPGITYCPEISLGRMVDQVLDIGAGIEVGVPLPEVEEVFPMKESARCIPHSRTCDRPKPSTVHSRQTSRYSPTTPHSSPHITSLAATNETRPHPNTIDLLHRRRLCGRSHDGRDCGSL